MTHSLCSFVSGTEQPRAAAIRFHAEAGSTPLAARTQAASSEERPIPCRQWMAIVLPDASSCSSRRTRFNVAFCETGVPRSSIGKAIKAIFSALLTSSSLAKSSSALSSFVKVETTRPIPMRRQDAASSSTQSPPRGRGMIANRPGQGPSIQYSSACMVCTHTEGHFPPTRIKSWAFSSNAAITASSSDKPDALKRFCVSMTRR